MISDKMIEAAVVAMKDKDHTWRQVDDIIMASIGAAWARFYLGDKDTWPKTEYAPSGKAWLCLTHYNDGTLSADNIFISAARWSGCMAYCDPADLMPNWSKT